MSQAHRFFEQFAPSLEQFSSKCRRKAHSSWKYALPCLLLILFSLPPRTLCAIHIRSHCGHSEG